MFLISTKLLCRKQKHTRRINKQHLLWPVAIVAHQAPESPGAVVPEGVVPV